MIAINTEKGLIRFSTWEEMTERPGFTTRLDPTQHKFKAVIGNYVEKVFVRCGIISCNTEHGKGYIVTTEDGTETRIGKDCGHKIFGIDFDHEVKRFDRDKTAAEDRDALYSFSFRIEDLEAKISGLRKCEHGASWIQGRLSALRTLGQEVPSAIVSQLGDLARRRDTRIERYREITKDEREREETRLGRALRDNEHAVVEFSVEIVGLEAMYPEHDLRRLLAIELEDELRGFKKRDIDSMGHVELRRWAKWVGGVDSQLDRIEAAITLGRRLLAADNLRPLLSLLTARVDEQAFKRYLSSLR